MPDEVERKTYSPQLRVSLNGSVLAECRLELTPAEAEVLARFLTDLLGCMSVPRLMDVHIHEE